MMPLTLRPGQPEDATSCGIICYEAFKAIAEQHHFAPGYPSPDSHSAPLCTIVKHFWKLPRTIDEQRLITGPFFLLQLIAS